MKNKIYIQSGSNISELKNSKPLIFKLWSDNSEAILNYYKEYKLLNYSKQNFSTFPNVVLEDDFFETLRDELNIPKGTYSVSIHLDSGERNRCCEIYSKSQFDKKKKQFEYIEKMPKLSFGAFMALSMVLSNPIRQ